MRNFPVLEGLIRRGCVLLAPLKQKRHCANAGSTRATSGETLVETLIAILICTLAFVVLVSATLVSTELNKQAQTADEKIAYQQVAAEEWNAGYIDIANSPENVLVGSGASYDRYEVTVYGHFGDLRSYEWTGTVNGEVLQ